ncbi:MAG: SulP family inorganic anion transporter, partial [Saonia sp.]
YFILRGNIKLAYFFKREEHTQGETIQMELAQEVSFLNKAAIKQTFIHLPNNSKLVIDASNTVYIDHDVLQIIRDFVGINSKEKNISVALVGFRKEYRVENSQTHVTSILPETDEQISPKTVKDGTKVPSNYLKLAELNQA